MYNYLQGLVNSYKNLGYNYYLIYFNDIENTDNFNTEILKSDVICYFAKSPILQNSNYTFLVEDDCVKVTLNYNIITNNNLVRQNTNLITEEFEEITINSNSYVFTNSELQTGTELVYNVYPSFAHEIKTSTNLDFTNFVLVLLFVTIFIVLIFRKLIFGG